MKKLFHLLLALTVAVSFSAFAPEPSVDDNYYYEDEEQNVHVYTGDICPIKNCPVCLVYIQGHAYRLYHDANLTIPVWGHCPE